MVWPAIIAAVGSVAAAAATPAALAPMSTPSGGSTEAVFNNSGWVVNFGAGDVDQENSSSAETRGGGLRADAPMFGADGAIGAGLPQGWETWALVALGGLLLWKLARKS